MELDKELAHPIHWLSKRSKVDFTADIVADKPKRNEEQAVVVVAREFKVLREKCTFVVGFKGSQL